MTDISTVAKEINSNALIKKHDRTDLSLSLSSLSSIKPMMSTAVSSPIKLADCLKQSSTTNLDDDYDLDDKLKDQILFISESNEVLNEIDSNNEKSVLLSDNDESVRII